MKKLEWLLNIADKKPLLFSVALMLLIIGYLVKSNMRYEERLNNSVDGQHILQVYYEDRIDSIVRYYDRKTQDLDKEVKQTLNSIIVSYEEQLKEQKAINDRINTTITENRKSLKHAKR